jgi:hypothetical protein
VVRNSKEGAQGPSGPVDLRIPRPEDLALLNHWWFDVAEFFHKNPARLSTEQFLRLMAQGRAACREMRRWIDGATACLPEDEREKYRALVQAFAMEDREMMAAGFDLIKKALRREGGAPGGR